MLRVGTLFIGLALPIFTSGIQFVSADVVDDAKAAIVSGHVVPERDLAPLIAAARSAKDKDDQEHLIDVIGDLGAADGSSPASVKRYLLEQSMPFLIEVAGKRGSDVFLRWEAMTSLRSMNAPRSVLMQLADMCEKDSDDFIKSRGEILRNYAQSLPEKSENDAVKPMDAGNEQQGIAYLKSKNLGVSLDQLRQSALAGNADEVRALLSAGVDPNGGSAQDSPLNRALQGCSSANGSEQGIAETVAALIKGGANVNAKDENDNTPILSAGQYCGPTVAQALIAGGAEVNVTNKTGITPLQMALIMQHLDTADALVAKGARLTAAQAQVVSNTQDPRAKAIIKKALKK